MPYLATHPFVPYVSENPHPDDELICGYPRDQGICVHRAHHPIHDTARPEVERIAFALATRKWVDEHDIRSVHTRHEHSSDCALCMRDVHAIAAAVLEIQAGQ